MSRRSPRMNGVFVVLFVLSAIVSLIPFSLTAYRSIGWTDSGELLAVGQTLGIAHPTGYPLFTLLVRVALLLNPGFTPVLAANLFSALCVALAVGLVSLTVASLVSGPTDRGAAIVASGFAGGMMMAGIGVVWQQAVSLEVYALQCLLFSVILFLLVQRTEIDSRPAGEDIRAWMLIGLGIGLGFANHMTTMYLLPAVVYAAVAGARRETRNARLFALAAFAAVGLSAYLYIPLRARSSPPLNWGDPTTLASLWAHLTGKQYSVWMFSGFDAFRTQLTTFLGQVQDEAGWIVIVCAFIGAFHTYNTHRRAFWILTISALVSVLYSCTYDIFDLEPYFLLFYCVLAVFAGAGLMATAKRMEGRLPTAISVGAMIVIGMVTIVTRYARVTTEGERSPESIARSVLAGAGQNATILTTKWDFLYSPALALQHVEGLRRDVILIDLHLLRDRTWYARRMRERVGGLGPETGVMFDRFILELEKFERGEPFVYETIRRRWQDLLRALLAASAKRGPVLADHLALQELPAGQTGIPNGFLLSLFDSTDQPPERPDIPEVNAGNDEFGADYRRFVSVAFLNHAAYARAQGLVVRSDSALQHAAVVDPTNPLLPASRIVPRPEKR